jgi:hypothetical protein
MTTFLSAATKLRTADFLIPFSIFFLPKFANTPLIPGFYDCYSSLKKKVLYLVI